jgi:general secretion pathway protein D
LKRVWSLALALVWLAGCATGQAIKRGDAAAQQGDWDAAVAHYREAVGKDPDDVELKIKLERAVQTAGANHLNRARQLEEQDQLPGAAAEYKKAADIDPSSIVALAKYRELERRIRLAQEAARPPTRVETLRAQAAQSSAIPRLDPRALLPRLSFQNAAVRDVLRTISDLTRININPDRDADRLLSQPFTFEGSDMSVEEFLNQVLQANRLTYKVVNSNSIFVYEDSAAKRTQFEDQYIQPFYISYGDATEINQQLGQIIGGFQGLAIRPVITPNKTLNALTVKATAPMMEIISGLIASMDKPQPEVLIEAEILEVNRNFVRQLGLDLNEWALGFTFSPEVAPPLTSGTFPPVTPPPFNLNTVTGGISAADFYVTSPTALVRLLESNSDTKVLARPQIRGAAGQPAAIQLGDQIPIPTTVFSSFAAGGTNNVPTTSVQYTPVGINLLFTPRVTYNEDIVLDQLQLDKSALGANILVGGQIFPTINSRIAKTTLHLRDGESALIGGLFRDDERKTIQSFPGLSKIPGLNQIFGNSDSNVDQTDLVMVITPRIIRSHQLRTEDLSPRYVGTGTMVGTGQPGLLSEAALAGTAPSASPAPTVLPGSGPATDQQTSPTTSPTTPAPTSPAPSPSGTAAPAGGRAPGIVPIEAVPSTSASPGTAPGAPQNPVRVAISLPSATDGTVSSGSGPFTMPIQISNAKDVASVALAVTYTTGVLTSPVPAQGGTGAFMRQGNATPTFAQSGNPATGRVDMVVARPAGMPGASGDGLLGAISFVAGMPGTATVTLSGIVTTTSGQSVPVEFGSTRVVVK